MIGEIEEDTDSAVVPNIYISNMYICMTSRYELCVFVIHTKNIFSVTSLTVEDSDLCLFNLQL